MWYNKLINGIINIVCKKRLSVEIIILGIVDVFGNLE